MQERYEEAIKETFKYLDDYTKSSKNTSLLYCEAIEHHLKMHGFTVRCSMWHDGIIIYPKQGNLPIHFWRKK